MLILLCLLAPHSVWSGVETCQWSTTHHQDPPDLSWLHGCYSDWGPAASGGQKTVLANDRNGGRLRLIASRHYYYYYYTQWHRPAWYKQMEKRLSRRQSSTFPNHSNTSFGVKEKISSYQVCEWNRFVAPYFWNFCSPRSQVIALKFFLSHNHSSLQNTLNRNEIKL